MKDVQGVAARLSDALGQLSGNRPERILAVRAPARTEIAGNHTDHEGGQVIAGALNCSIECLAVARPSNEVRVFSQGFEPVVVKMDDLSPRKDEQVSSMGLVRGMAAQMAASGRTPQGFDLVMRSTIPSGGGLSSSAAYELALCRAMEALWEGPAVSAVEAAQMAQRVEQDWFGKPCGLMDQLAVSLGGLAWMDFIEEEPRTEKRSCDFSDYGYALVLTDVGCDHSAHTGEYAAVPQEMKLVAQSLGFSRLCELDESAILSDLPALRKRLGDRPLLRALHYFEEMDLVAGRWDALGAEDIERFLALTRRSGASSGMFLQNVSAAGAPDQDAMLALALSERLLGRRGASRIHGGGFGGSIQAFVPLDLLDTYVNHMGEWLGAYASKVYEISDEGAVAQWM